jgi:hypothetical protein
MFLSVLIPIDMHAGDIVAHHDGPARRSCYLQKTVFLVRPSRAARDGRARALHVTG